MSTDILAASLAGTEIRPGLLVLPGQGNSRALKADLCRTRAGEVEPFVSRSCYRSSAHLLDRGETSWTALG